MMRRSSTRAGAASPSSATGSRYTGRRSWPSRRRRRRSGDALGGDRAAEEVVAGALEAAAPDIVPILHGPEGLDTGGLELVVAPDRIEMDEKPADAVRAKPQSSLVAACRSVGEGHADAAF